MHYRFTEGTAAIRGANDPFSLVRDAFPVAISRTIPNGFGPRSVAQGERWLSHAGPDYTLTGKPYPGVRPPRDQCGGRQGSSTGSVSLRAVRSRRCECKHSQGWRTESRLGTHGQWSQSRRWAWTESSVLRVRARRNPLLQRLVHCAYDECSMSAGAAKVPGVTCTPRLFMLARRQSSTAS